MPFWEVRLVEFWIRSDFWGAKMILKGFGGFGSWKYTVQCVWQLVCL